MRCDANPRKADGRNGGPPWYLGTRTAQNTREAQGAAPRRLDAYSGVVKSRGAA